MVSSNSTPRSAPGWLDYITLKEAKQWCQLPSSDDPDIDPNLQLITSMACDHFQATLGKPLCPTPFSYRFDGFSGWNGVFIELPYYPVLEITSVTEWRGTSGAYVLPESTPDVQVDGWQCEYPVGRLIRVFPGNIQKPWFPGSRNVEVQWIGGFNPIPPRVRVMTLELIKYWWVNVQNDQAMNASGPSVEYGGPTGLWPGVPARIDKFIQSLMQVGLG